MSSRADRAILAGVVLLVASTAWAQSPVPATNDVHPDSTHPAGAASGSPTEPVVRPHSDNSYVIGDNDQLDIEVWKDPDVSKTVTVRSDGKISLQLVGEIQASGKTPLQLEEDITNRLKESMLQPIVTVIVLQSNSQKYNIMGGVIRPGSYQLTVTTRVMDALANAGGFKDFAKKKSIRILRQKPDGTETRLTFNYEAFIKGKNPQSNIKLLPGDTIVVN
jgi:polysaccharide export outer membrane protein